MNWVTGDIQLLLPSLLSWHFYKNIKISSVLPLMLAETSVTKWSDLNIFTMVAISLYATYKASLLKALYLPLWSRLSFLGQATEKINSPTFFYLNLCMCWNLCVCYLICSNLPDIKWRHVKIWMSYLRQRSKLTRKLKSNVTGSINLSAVQLHFMLKNAMGELSLHFNLWFCTIAGLVLCHTVITVIMAPN